MSAAGDAAAALALALPLAWELGHAPSASRATPCTPWPGSAACSARLGLARAGAPPARVRRRRAGLAGAAGALAVLAAWQQGRCRRRRGWRRRRWRCRSSRSSPGACCATKWQLSKLHWRSRLEPARRRLARLVSRDVIALDASQVRESAIETLAENLNDSVVAPLFWFAVAGLPGAVVYRFANTADAMWGYRGAVMEWAGKWAARADDLLSWLPARLTAGLLLPPGAAVSPALRREARRTPVAQQRLADGGDGAGLGVRLRKPRRLRARRAAPSPARQVRQALRAAAHGAWAPWCWRRRVMLAARVGGARR